MAHHKAKLRLRLYIAGNAPNSILATARAKSICEEHFPSAHEIEIVDLLAAPARAMADGVIVTPTLVKLFPLPVQRVIGNLSDEAQVLIVLRGS